MLPLRLILDLMAIRRWENIRLIRRTRMIRIYDVRLVSKIRFIFSCEK